MIDDSPDVEAGFNALLLADPSTSALIVDRVFPLTLPDDPVYPAVTYRVVSTTDTYTLDGLLSLGQVRLQVDSWGATYGDAKAVAKALRKLLGNFLGPLPNGVTVENTKRDAQGDGFDSNQRAYYVQTDWIIQFSE